MGYILTITVEGHWAIDCCALGQRRRRVLECADYELAEATRRLLAANLN